MATVTLTWQIEGIHDGIGVYRSNQLNTGYEQIATLAPNTTTFQDEFLLSQLTDKYGTEPETLFYRLDAFRGLDVKQSEPVPVPLEDTMPEFLDGVEYLDPVPELSFNDEPVTYYSLGAQSIDGTMYHVLAGVRPATSRFITNPANDYGVFPEINQFLRGLPLGAEALQDAIEFTTLAKQQLVITGSEDMRVDALLPFITREQPVFEVLPTKALMTQLQSQITELSNSLTLSGFFWTSTMTTATTNEFGQITDINVARHPVTGGDDEVSILSDTSAMTLTLLLIEEITQHLA